MLAATTAAATVATAARSTVTVTKKVAGPQAVADRWGYVEVTLVVRKTTTTIGGKTRVTRKITGVNVPIYPNHTDRSVFINSQALPWLKQEVLQAQFNPNIQMVGGATATSYAFEQSLQAAILDAKKI
ncbi:MAG: hypothetical protein KGL94_12585 [Acidobacteriota bacterium]|nr:hypothetical protein [Acidobacteriota bacterium]